MGHSAVSKQLDAFMIMYMEDKKEQERQQLELRARIEELSLECCCSESAPISNKDQGSSSRRNHDKGKQDHEHEDNSCVPRYVKMELPRYDGLTDPLGWLIHCEYFFRHHHTLDREKIGIASFHLESDAQLWFLKWERDNSGSSCEDFKECNVRFGPILRCTRVGELSKLRQTGSVEEY